MPFFVFLYFETPFSRMWGLLGSGPSGSGVSVKFVFFFSRNDLSIRQELHDISLLGKYLEFQQFYKIFYFNYFFFFSRRSI